MKVDVKIIKRTEAIEPHEIEFPFYGWYSQRRDEIVKLDLKYFEHDKSKIEKVVILKARNGFAINPLLSQISISVSNNVIDEEILIFLRDYATPASDEEFVRFRIQTINALS